MYKRVISVLLITVIVFSLAACTSQEVSVTPSPSPTRTIDSTDISTPNSTAVPSESTPLSYREQLLTTLWNRLSELFDNPYAIAGIIGNMGRESRLCPWRYEGDNTENYVISKIRTNQINEDLNFPTRTSLYYFTYFGLHFDSRTGFGLCQWTALGYKNQLYKMALETNRKIDDPELQIDFLIMTLQRDKPELIDLLESSKSSLDSVQLFISLYEKGQTGPADLLRRHEIAECSLAMFAPEYAMEQFLDMSKEEMFELMDIPEPPTEEQLYEQS